MSLYVKHKKRLSSAKIQATGNADADDMALAAFDTQQALEFLIKHILTEHNIRYAKNHKIADMLSKLDTLHIFDASVKLRPYADRVYEWETRGTL